MMLKSKISFDVLLDEKSQLQCIVCHEGYTINPNKILGVYLFTKIIKISEENSLINLGQKTEIHGSTSVTHFTGIHLKCHLSAAKADKNMK